jgi:hypothetical protein
MDDKKSSVSSGGREHPSDTMRERVPEDSRKLWVLLNADRFLVAAGILGLIFVPLVGLGQAHPAGMPALFTDGDPLETLFQGLLTAIITGVTLVLTLSQLVLSQEQGPVGDQRERMQAAMDFRRDVETLIEEPVSPVQPSAFLRSIVKFTERRAEAVEAALRGADSEGSNRQIGQIEKFLESVKRNANAVRSNLEGARFGEFDVVFSALNYNYSWKIYAARRIRAENEDLLPDAAHAALDDLIDALVLFGPAREHFKTLYFQWELIDLSRLMLYSSIPALLTSIAGILYLEPALFSETVLGLRTFVVLVSAAVAVSLLPFALLLSYILRIATIAKRTLSIGPFILRETDRSRDLDWGEAEPKSGE